MKMSTLVCITMLYIVCLLYTIQADEETAFIFQPNKVNCIEGQECMLVCTIKNLGSGSLKWQRNNVYVSQLNRGHNIKYVETLTKPNTNTDGTYIQYNSLNIRNIDRSDAQYFYRCVATTGSDKVLYSANGTLQVAEVPPSHYPICSSEQTYSVGDDAKFTCTSEKTQNSKISLHWYRNNIPVIQNSRQRDDNEKILSELTVGVTAEDKGSLFLCYLLIVIDKSIKYNKSCTVGPLDITFGPKVSISGPHSIPVNGEALYVCSSTSNPPTTLNEWIEPELPNEAYSLENHRQVLRILKATLNMNGTHLRCLAVNSVERVEKMVTLKIESVYGPPPTAKLTPSTADSSMQVAPDVSKILSVAGVCLLLTAVLIGGLLCYLQFCKFGLFPMQTNEERIAQPEVYFEPKDNIRCMMSPYDDNGMYYKRNVAVQVTPGVDTDSVYAEVEEGKKT